LRLVPRRPAAEGSDETLIAILASPPPDPESVAHDLAAALTEATGGAVNVALRREGTEWTIVAGSARLRDGADLTELINDAAEAADETVAVEVTRHAAIVAQLDGAPSDRCRMMLRQACVWLTLAAERTVALDQEGGAWAETTVLRAVIQQLLTVHDLDQVLLSITDRTLHLLDADICGVLLKEGDELRMRSCVGNRVIETGRLRMTRGQGVAGLVFLTGEPARVDDYLRDRVISQDFMSLAEREQTRSALAVPLRLHGEFIGVLEVWRRRPSLFDEQDLARMVTLADVATIAIKNARLYDEQATTMAQLSDVRDVLEEQNATLRRSSALQRRLLDAVVEGAGPATIARMVAAETGCKVGVYASDGHSIARYPMRTLTSEMPTEFRPTGRTGRVDLRLTDGTEATAWVQPVVAEGDKVGCVCLLPGDEPPETMQVLTGQVAMACSLTLLRQRAASRARAQAMEQVLWDLLQGPAEHRVAARSRAQQMGVQLTGALRVLYGRLENIDELATEHGWDTSRCEKVRRDALRAIVDVDASEGLALPALRGDWIVAIARNLDRNVVKDLLSRLTSTIRDAVPGVRVTWGVSRPSEDPVALPRAFGEAQTALSAVHRLGGEGVFLYEELGIVRLLLGSGDDPDLQAFINDVTGPLIAYDRENDGALIRTLRTFFDANCSQRVASERLFIHHKTLRYRLEQIKQLTGLDLSRHDDRVRADVALRLQQLDAPEDQLTTHNSNP
jgi:sugar diacid utilization regulator/putative methionine-R-sulfoxide reductase with GAF domain